MTLEGNTFDNWRKEHQIILEKIENYTELPENEDIQKKKFALLNELLLNLCSNKNCKCNFRNISSLILLFLNFYKKNYPADIYSNGRKQNPINEKVILEVKHILKQELRNSNPILNPQGTKSLI